MRYLTLDEVVELQRRIVDSTGGPPGIRDLNVLSSAVAQPKMTFDGKDLYPEEFGKAAALGFALVKNHAFVDGNKRIGHAAMETFLILNGYEIEASVDDQERLILGIADSSIDRNQMASWLREHVVYRRKS